MWRPASHLGQLRWHEWEGERFLFDPFSGQTHVLNAMAAAVLDLIQEGPHSEAELLGRLGLDLAPAERQGLAATLPAHLDLLAEMGLVLAPMERGPDLYRPPECHAAV